MAQIRNNSNIVKGDELWLFIGESATTHPICFATQHQLSRSLSTNSVSSKDHGSSNYVTPGEGTWTCSSESLMSIADGPNGAYAFEKLMDLYEAQAEIYVKFGKISNYTGTGIVDVDVTGTPQANGWTMDTPYWEGKGYITNLQASGSHGDTATFSIEITGNGPLKKNSVTPSTHSITKTGTGASYVTLSANSATPGTVIRVTPTSGHGQSDLTVTSSVALTWAGSYWQFTMPNANVTITVTYNAPSPTTYIVTKTGTGSSYIGVAPSTNISQGTQVKVTPNNGYNYSYFTLSTSPSTSITGTGSYWYFAMPASDVELTADYNTSPSVGDLFSVGKTALTASNYTTVNNPTTISSYPYETTYSTDETAYGYILAKSNKTLNVTDATSGDTVNINEMQDVTISGYKAYKTVGGLNVGGTIRIRLS